MQAKCRGGKISVNEDQSSKDHRANRIISRDRLGRIAMIHGLQWFWKGADLIEPWLMLFNLITNTFCPRFVNISDTETLSKLFPDRLSILYDRQRIEMRRWI